LTKGLIPKEVRLFITENINSVFQLEVLLLLYNQKERGWSAEEVDDELGIGVEEAGRQLSDLHARGLLAVGKDQGSSYCYGPDTDELDQIVSGLARAYRERRINVISSIFSKEVDKVRLFAEAFRLRKD
jgi:hypothetical protein